MMRLGKDLLDELHRTLALPDLRPSQDEDSQSQEGVVHSFVSEFENWRNSGQGMIEPIFYSGAGAYSIQYLKLANGRYAHDREWIEEKKGISIDDIIHIHDRIVGLIPSFNADTIQGEGHSFEEECRYVLNAITFSIDDIPEIDDVLLESFLDLFSTIPGEYNVNSDFRGVGDYNAVNSSPIVKFSYEKYLLPLFGSLAESIYESPYYWMIEDETYKDIALYNRGKATESIVADMMTPIFGEKGIFQEVLIREGNRDITDIDILAVTGTKAVVIQAKSKKLTVPSRRGDQKSLKRDFQFAVQDAFSQALLCRDAILGNSHQFMHNGSDIGGLLSRIDEVFLLCVTGDTYPAVLFQVDRYLEKDDPDPHPVVMSLFDIDVAAYYLDNPFRLIHYIRQRTNHAEYFRTDSEISMLAFYMTQGLSPADGADLVFIEPGMSQL